MDVVISIANTTVAFTKYYYGDKHQVAAAG
jgi:hypothetical protein